MRGWARRKRREGERALARGGKVTRGQGAKTELKGEPDTGMFAPGIG